ncbi:hypothetical protein BDL97_01G080200 [Sphagnum fallax]|nr:hypothetical protein BDL97_01G080200 [Sphagnum fallax]KAH8974036.1 hypothetical protein BDL97_01G080200 [Sphagnum fallax]
MSLRKSGHRGGVGNPSTPADEDVKVKELRARLGPLTGRSLQYATDSCLKRYLNARNWNIKKAEKMIRESLKWRATYKPEEICWKDVATETETGKVYRANFHDKQGHPVVVMHPGRQNTNNREGQIRQLVYTMENAVLNMPPGQEQMVWLVDFKGWTLSKAIPIKTVQETAHVLQLHYPERLYMAILYNPPHIFETFYMIVKPFLDPTTAAKVKFVYSDNAESMKILHTLFDKGEVEPSLAADDFHFTEYGRQMQNDDERTAITWNLGGEADNSPVANISTLKLEPVVSSSERIAITG